ncbi:hypothetical protein POTOM_040654 [Populus tomentosa]|uniref:Pentatricopeptide repeat-containing protein n=1 Tax=Populus tomentosa TaxID=118781 RepID=A0A8X7Z150_POPTO|nr:hypothetical protein POTOM_040654 [Populus tomentosa]
MNTKLISKTLIQNQNAIISRSYYTNKTNKATLYSKLSPLGSTPSLEPELDSWIQSGKKVSEWMNKKGICIFSPSQHAVQLDLIGRVHGFVSAENYFNNLRDQDKNEKTYGALLNCYVQKRETDKSISHLQKMKEMGFAKSSLSYNDIMCLYTNVGQHEKVPQVLNEMKENNVSPDNFSYRLCMNSYGARGDLEGMEKMLNEMEHQPDIVVDWNSYAVAASSYIKGGLTDKAIDSLKKSETRLDKKDGTGYNHLISLYAALGKKTEVLRLWNLEKSTCERPINKDYINIMASLVKLDEFEEVEKVLKEWEASGNFYDVRVPNTLIIGYSGKGLYEKAKALLENLTEKGKATLPNIWGKVAAGFFDKNEVAKAFSCMKAALCLYEENKEWKPNQKVISGILSWLGDEGSAEDAEAFVSSLKNVIPMNREMYHAVLKAHIRAGKEVHGLLDDMKTYKIKEDEETKKILSMMQK